MPKTKALIILSLLLSVGLVWSDEFVDDERLITHLGERYSIGDKWVSASHKTTTVAYNQITGARYIRVSIRPEQQDGSDWYLAVRDGSSRLIQSFRNDSFAGNAVQWSTRIPGSTAVFTLYTSAASRIKIHFDQYFVMPDKAPNPYYSWLGANPRYEDLYGGQNEEHRSLGDFTSFLLVSWGLDSWCCSGILLSPTLLLTNWHCGNPQRDDFPASATWNPEMCKQTLIDLSWDGDGISNEYVCENVVWSNDSLDYALLRIRPMVAGNISRSAIVNPHIETNQSVVIIHHAQGLKKQISSECVVANVGDTFFLHNCDTAGGSSGGPIFDDLGYLIGIHRRGFKSDSINKLNESIRMDRLLEDIRQNQPELVPEIQLVVESQ